MENVCTGIVKSGAEIKQDLGTGRQENEKKWKVKEIKTEEPTGDETKYQRKDEKKKTTIFKCLSRGNIM